jgi:hypothetical protein
MNAFCASENFDAFIASAPSPNRDPSAENSSQKRSSFRGTEQSRVRHPATISNSYILEHNIPESFIEIALANLGAGIYEGIAVGLQRRTERFETDGLIIAEDPGHKPLPVGARLVLRVLLNENRRFSTIYMCKVQTNTVVSQIAY